MKGSAVVRGEAWLVELRAAARMNRVAPRRSFISPMVHIDRHDDRLCSVACEAVWDEGDGGRGGGCHGAAVSVALDDVTYNERLFTAAVLCFLQRPVRPKTKEKVVEWASGSEIGLRRRFEARTAG